MFRYNNSNVFAKGNIAVILKPKYDNIKTIINSESENYILNVNESEYIKHLENTHTLIFPELKFDEVTADSYEADVPAEYFPFDYNVYPGKTYKKEVIQFFIPVIGNIDILNYTPADIIYIGGGGRNFRIKDRELVVEFINFNNNPDDIKGQYDREVNEIQCNYGALRKNIEDYNTSLEAYIKNIFTERKKAILSKKSLLSSLGVPLRKKPDTPATFSVPKPQLREKIVVRPSVTVMEYKPEPTLDEGNYHNILKLINDVGKNFERMPSVYKEKGEEALRDHILMILDPNFDLGTATGETFNKSGKTDIQLRYDSSVVFIAECKFWSGEKNYLATIDQLLNYLTWRDTKASVILFVKQKDFTSILNKVNSETSSHPNYLGYVNNSDENWFNFRFHINGDKNREVKLAVQLYHLP